MKNDNLIQKTYKIDKKQISIFNCSEKFIFTHIAKTRGNIEIDIVITIEWRGNSKNRFAF
jgi:hypothetical protein